MSDTPELPPVPPEPIDVGPPPMEYRWGLILLAAIVAVSTATLAAVTIRQDNTAVLVGFGGVMVTQLLAMLRGHMGDLAATRERRAVATRLRQTQATAVITADRLNGGLDERIRAVVTEAVSERLAAVCGGIDDVRDEVHKIKHDVKGLHVTHQMIQGLLETAAERKPEPDARRLPGDATPDEKGAGGAE